MIDYVMTVAVSTTSAVEQITSAIPALIDERVLIGVIAIALITIGNLRGLREAGNIFAIPTYLFIGSAFLMIAIGAFRIVVGGEGTEFPPEVIEQAGHIPEQVGILLLLRAFAAGAVALTGTEAIATGVPAFEPPEAKNAATTLAAMALILGILFIGITFLAVNFGITHLEFPEKQTVISQVARRVYGDGSIFFYVFQAFTALLLFLAANTSFNAFPRLLAILAGDSHMPRQFGFRGDRLAFSYGIIVLAVVASAADRGLRRRDASPHPALRGRRLHRLHDQPGRHDPPLASGAAAGLAAAPGHQRLRLQPDGDRGGRRDGGQGARLVHRPGPDPAPRRPDAGHPAPVRRSRPSSSASARTSCLPGRTASSGRSCPSTASTGRSSRP